MPSDTGWQQITLRLSPDVLEDAEEVARLMSTPDLPVVRAEALRAAVRRGLAELRSELGGKASKGKRAR